MNTSLHQNLLNVAFSSIVLLPDGQIHPARRHRVLFGA